MKPALSIVIVNSDGLDDTLQCLQSIHQYPPQWPFEIVLVDNCSQVDCISRVNRRYPEVRTYSAPHRQGFAKNYNLGIGYTSGDYVIILNNDTVVTRGALDALIAEARRNPAYGMLGPRLLSNHGAIQPDCARALPTPTSYALASLLLDHGMPLGRLLRRYQSWRISGRRTGAVACISGACMLVTRDVLDRIGPLDEGFDFYYEDVEWCHRVRAHDKHVVYVAESHIVHFGDQSLSKVKVWAKQSEYRSALRYFQQYHDLSARQAWMIWLVTALSFLLRGMAFLLKERKSQGDGYARTYFYLWSWVLHQHPASSEIAALRAQSHARQTIGGLP